jgi:hypothetical protein
MANLDHARWEACLYAAGVVDSPTISLRAELERLGATFRRGRTGYISMTDYGHSGIALSGPTHEQPRRWWRGQSSEALALLAPLPDGTDLEAIWQALHRPA